LRGLGELGLASCHRWTVHSFSVSSVISVVNKEEEVWLRPQAALGDSCNSLFLCPLILRRASLLIRPLIFLIEVKVVQDAVEDGSQDNADGGQKDDPAEQGIRRGEDL